MSGTLRWQPYDPTWLVDLAKEQYPEQTWLHQALARCTKCLQESRAYIYFVSQERPNQPGSEWQFKRNVPLDSKKEGPLVLDVLEDGRIGGFEIIKRI